MLPTWSCLLPSVTVFSPLFLPLSSFLLPPFSPHSPPPILCILSLPPPFSSNSLPAPLDWKRVDCPWRVREISESDFQASEVRRACHDVLRSRGNPASLRCQAAQSRARHRHLPPTILSWRFSEPGLLGLLENPVFVEKSSGPSFLTLQLRNRPREGCDLLRVTQLSSDTQD